MTLAVRERRRKVAGIADPRLAPPVPVASQVEAYKTGAKDLGLRLMPWQVIAARFLTATAGKKWRYREVCIVVARQNGKTTLLLPLILMALRRGDKVLHTAQNRALPRETFLQLARLLGGHRDVAEIRFANGQELIRFNNGGRYTLVAPRPGVRGYSVDLVLLDEVREQHSFDLLAGIKPTLTASRNPQIVHLSNAGDADSVVLNDLRRRKDTDPGLAYLEWSASPERTLDDVEGWQEANPALGTTIQLETLTGFLESFPPAVFETEHLCRWVVTMQPKLVSEAKWEQCRSDLERQRRPAMGISVDASGKRASAVLAWQQTDGTIACRVIADVHGDPIDVDLFGEELRQRAVKDGAVDVAFDDLTDRGLAAFFKTAKPLTGRQFANACANFVRVIESGRLRWDEADQITHDLSWTARRPLTEGAWVAVKAKEDRPITASLAAIRAVQLASGPRPSAPKVF